MNKGKGTQFLFIFMCPEVHRKEVNFNKGNRDLGFREQQIVGKWLGTTER